MQLNDYIFKKAQKSGILSLPIPQRYVVAVYTAQAIIDNGGFEYLLENSFYWTPNDIKEYIEELLNTYYGGFIL